MQSMAITDVTHSWYNFFSESRDVLFLDQSNNGNKLLAFTVNVDPKVLLVDWTFSFSCFILHYIWLDSSDCLCTVLCFSNQCFSEGKKMLLEITFELKMFCWSDFASYRWVQYIKTFNENDQICPWIKISKK